MFTKKRSGYIKSKGFGLIHIYYGNGVGKTNRAVGLAILAAEEGIMVDFVQFLKSDTSSEVAVFNNIENIRYWRPGTHPFIMPDGPQFIHHQHARSAFEQALSAIENDCQLLICDEILDMIYFNLLKVEQIIDLARRCKDKVELVMTGRHVSPDLLEVADYATEMVLLKAPPSQ